jgi:hypothetical protein
VSHTVPLPKDAELVELRPDWLTFRSRKRVPPGARVDFALVMEGRPWPLQATAVSSTAQKEGTEHVYLTRLSLEDLPDGDRHLIGLFIEKGRGSPGLASSAR